MNCSLVAVKCSQGGRYNETTTMIAGANVGGGVSRRSNSPDSDHLGEYEFDGYNLTLRFDKGLVQRLLTFTSGDDYEKLWFEGETLSRE